MNRTLAAALVLSSVAALSGCKEGTLVDGKIPAGYEQYAREAEGTYSGTISNNTSIGKSRAMSVKLSVVNDRVVLTPSTDWLGAGCGSKVGNLVSVQTSGLKLKTAVFAFNGGKCQSTGRLVVRMFGQSSGHPKVVAWVTTGYGQYSDQGGLHTTSYETRALLKKQ